MRISYPLRVMSLGVVTWLVPFVTSVLLMDRTGAPRISVDLFKSLMVVVGTGVGAWCLVGVRCSLTAHGRCSWLIGGIWFALNVALDLAILLPLTGMPMDDYVRQIGVRYLTIPIVAVAIDAAVASASRAPARRPPH